MEEERDLKLSLSIPLSFYPFVFLSFYLFVPSILFVLFTKKREALIKRLLYYSFR